VSRFREFRQWIADRISPEPEPPVYEDESEDPANWLSLDYVHEQLTAQIKQQWDIWDTMDGRLRLILGVIGIVFAAALAFQRGQAPPNNAVSILTAIAVGVYLVAAAIVARAYWPQKFDWPPRPESLWEFIPKTPEESKR
jgi:hypothetical protein